MRASSQEPDEVRDDQPMLWDESDPSDHDASTKPFVRPRKKRKCSFGWPGWLILCSFSILALSGFMFLQFFRQQTSIPTTSETPPQGEQGHNDDVAHGGADSAEDNENTEESSDDTDTDTKTELTLAQQLDLQTGFIVSNVPKTREFVFNITRERYAPDGFEKEMILVNGQSPGPLIEANSNDVLRITINNQMPNASTTIHWHGIDQRNTNWMDGVNGITQCGIPPGESFVYEFNVTDQRGTYWYHSHASVQYTDGLYGPLIIHDSDEMVPKVDDEKIMMFGDWYHEDVEQLLTDYLGTSPPWSSMAGMEPPPSNMLLNGMHVSNCSAPASSHKRQMMHSSSSWNDVSRQPPKDCTAGSPFNTRVKKGDKVRFRLISHSTSTPLWFSIDNHTLSIVEIDGVEVEPIATAKAFLNPGQRYSVIVNANQTVGNYRLRASADVGCFHLASSGNTNLAPYNFEANGILSYDGADPKDATIGKPWDLESLTTEVVGDEPWIFGCEDLPFYLPKPMRKRDPYEVGERNHLYFEFVRSRTDGVIRTTINQTMFSPLEGDATIWRVPDQDLSQQNLESEAPEWNFGDNQLVLVSRDSDKAAEIVVNSGSMMMHPFHLHGQNFQVVGWGKGSYGEGKTEWNMDNPMRRDTLTLHGSSHAVLRIKADNPGVWAFHCHIQWHAEDGMFVTIGQRLDELSRQFKSLGKADDGEAFKRRFCAGPKS